MLASLCAPRGVVNPGEHTGGATFAATSVRLSPGHGLPTMLTKINSISNAGVYRDFRWAEHVISTGPEDPAAFADINVLYGRNYSGKTTLSRIIRSLELRQLPPKLTQANFSLEFDEGPLTQASLSTHVETVRVFNDDFVRDNLSVFFTDGGRITPFAVLGAENNAILAKVAELETELGSVEAASGLLYKQHNHLEGVRKVQAQVDKARTELAKKLDDKANKKPDGLKHNKLYGEANYRVPRLEQDIAKALDPRHSALDEDTRAHQHAILKEEAKESLSAQVAPVLGLAPLLEAANKVLTQKVAPSIPIQDLVNEALLQAWVRDGRALHEDRRTTCGFCGGVIPKELWSRMDQHFNEESETLRAALEDVQRKVAHERREFASWQFPAADRFYSEFQSKHSELVGRKSELAEAYEAALGRIDVAVKERLVDVFTPLSPLSVVDPSSTIAAIHEALEALKASSNAHTASIGERRDAAVNALLLDDVRRFAQDYGYGDKKAAIETLEAEALELRKIGDELVRRVADVKNQIATARAAMKDETRGAGRVNELLSNFFGHKALTLASVETEAGYQFEIRRGDQPATHLSQGECGLVAFCYFVAKLSDVDTANTKPLVWIDDPVSSLDANHVFFLFGLIRYEIMRAERCSQLFISTHHLDFLKFAMEVKPAGTKLKIRCFLIERSGDISKIKLMPYYFRKQVSEFVYLFHYIYECAHIDDGQDAEERLGSYANNARKFLEIYLAYRYPGPANDGEKLSKFFEGNGVGAALVERIHHEYSHLGGRFERALLPLDVSEMRTCAKYIIDTIETKDKDQFEAFKKAIGA